MKHTLFRVVTKVTIFATVFLTVLGAVTPAAYADTTFTSVQDRMTRLQENTTSTHTFNIDLPASIDWDATGSSDIIWIKFASSTNAFTLSASTTWTVTSTAQFTIKDNGATADSGTNLRVGGITSTDTTGAISASGSWPTCTAPEAVAISVNVTDRKFGFRRCYGAGAVEPLASGFITITIGSTGPTGTITNPASQSNDQLATISMDDNGGVNSYSQSIAYSILDSDVITGSGAPQTTSTLTFAINRDAMSGGTATACNSTSQTAAATVSFNTLAVGTMNVATSTICTYVVATGANTVTATVYGYSVNAGLKSGSTYLAGSTYATTALKAGSAFTLTTADNGYCFLTDDLGSAESSGGAAATSPFNGTCTFTGNELSGAGSFTTSLASIWTDTDASSASYAHIVPKAVILSTTAAGTYTDTLYFVAAGTF